MSKVVHVLSSFKVGGAERFVLDIAETQSAAGQQVMVFSTDPSPDILYMESSSKNFLKELSSGKRLKDFSTVLRFLGGGNGLKAIHFHSPWVLRYFILLLPLLRLRGVNIVYTRHGLNSLPGRAWSVIHMIARPWVNWVTFVSDAGLKVFGVRFGWRENILKTVSNGVFVPEIVSRESSRALRIGSVGRMVALKSQKDLIQAVSQLQKSEGLDIEVHFFGDGEERELLDEKASNELDRCTVFFHGMQLDRQYVYGKFDLLVVCSEQEGLSLAIMEAMARGIPVIATNVGDSPRLVIDGFTGFLYEYGDIEELRRLIRFISERPDKLVLLGEKARAHMLKSFSMQASNQQYQECYQR